MYKFIRSILFFFPPEWVHYFSMNSLRLLCSIGFRKIIKNIYKTPALPIKFLGLKFNNPVGLGAGFDKNAKYLRELEILGFGFIEIGTVTPLAQKGNSKPRLFRLPKDKALINRMGFNNDGVDKIVDRLKNWKVGSRESGVAKNKSQLIIGGNIGKNKITPNDEAWKDYEICFNKLHDYVDYFVVNVSSPNTPGLRELQEKGSLKKILTHLQELNRQKENQKPLLLKIAPDLTYDQVDDVLDLTKEINLDGLVVSNTTISREGLQTSPPKIESIGQGGLSGLPLKKRNTELLTYINKKTAGNIPVIASGGIFNAEDANEKLHAGANLIQVWTGFIYEGPAIVKKICSQLIRK